MVSVIRPAVQLSLSLPEMARLDLDDDERDVLIQALRSIIGADRFPLSPRIRALRRILAKLEQSPAPPEPDAAAPRGRRR
jgi:hypothetical protein